MTGRREVLQLFVSDVECRSPHGGGRHVSMTFIRDSTI